MVDDPDVDKPVDAEIHNGGSNEEEGAAHERSSEEVAVDVADVGANADREVGGEQSAAQEPVDVVEDDAGSEEADVAEDVGARTEGDASDDDAEAAMLSMLQDLPKEEPSGAPDDISFGSASVSSAEFEQLQQPAAVSEPLNIDLLMDVDLPISIELGRTKMSIADILALGPGSVVELSKLAGEPVDLLINQKVVARGEVVVVDENFGLRITQLMTPEERLKALAEE